MSGFHCSKEKKYIKRAAALFQKELVSFSQRQSLISTPIYPASKHGEKKDGTLTGNTS